MFLTRMVENKRAELNAKGNEFTLSRLRERLDAAPPVRSFKKAIEGRRLAVIAEVKKASPSAGVFAEEFDPVAIAVGYEKAGADAVSVLTDEKYFGGSIEHLTAIRERCSLPLLRKDFVVDVRQVYESRASGADAVLLISTILDNRELDDLMSACEEVGMDALVEVHTDLDLHKALQTGASTIGINNRDLDTFEVDLKVTETLAPLIPKDKIVVSMSGIKKRKDVVRLRQFDINAILVGEAMMRSGNVAKTFEDLIGTNERR